MISEESKNIGQLLSQTPLWIIFLATLVIMFAAFEGGFLIGRYRREHSDQEKDSPVGPMVGATLGLLAFMLAFTFGVASTHFTTRRHLLLDEANAIRATYVMTVMLGKSPGIQSRKLLREYADIRFQDLESANKLKDRISEANAIQDQLWSLAMSCEEKGSGTPSAWLYIQSLSDMIDLHTKRISYGTHRRIPTSIWIMLYFIAILGMAAMGYHAGLIGLRGFFAYLVLVLTFSMVIALIYDLDRPKQKLFRVSPQAMIDLKQRMIEPEL